MTVDSLLAAPTWSLRRLLIVSPAEVEQLADVLIDCVDGGASVSFMAPLHGGLRGTTFFYRRISEAHFDEHRPGDATP
jgi:hypothetical protein